MYKKDNRTFNEKLEIGNKKEDELVEILNWCGIPARINNKENVRDIDIELTYDDMFVDCKLVETPFYKSKQYVNIDPDKCLPMNVSHIQAYDKKEKATGKKCWVAFFVNFKDFNVRELIFIPNSQLVYLVNNGLIKAHNDKVSFSREIGRDVYSFLDYVKQLRKINKK
ncbi:gp685 [Bacillus phage G]|uniref:Gp685 n=1 Tax=Bacillus phage G TaxID=2884420 RepID=G3MB65_9CAUD|nr:gp685 [Bacillus phage G]AEO93928.1 gp685 [Bacillus phage G]